MTPAPSMKHPLRPILAAAGLLALAACNVVPPAQDDPTRYFVLADAGVSASHSEGTLRVGLKSVQLEGYLKRKDIVIRTGANEVEFRDFRLWAEPLDSGVSRVLRQALRASPPVGQVYAEPFPVDGARDYDVSVEILHCEGAASGSGQVARLSAVYEISTVGPQAHVVARRRFDAPDQAWDGRDYGSLAGLLSADIASLGADIARNLPPLP